MRRLLDGSSARGHPSRSELARWRAKLLLMTFEELESHDLCECGQRLSTHPAVAKPRPLGSKRKREMSEEAAERVRAASADWHRWSRQG